MAAVAVIPSGCLSSPTGVDLEDREPIPRVEALDFGGVETAGEWDYWELRWMLPPDGDSIVGSAGRLTRTQLPPRVQDELDPLSPDTGFAQGCRPVHCFKFLAAVSGLEVDVRTTRQGLRDFLGEVQSLTEAVLLLDAHQFFWDDGQVTGWRGTPQGWEFVVLETVTFCAPIQTDRVRLLVDASGELHERAREVWRRLEGACV